MQYATNLMLVHCRASNIDADSSGSEQETMEVQLARGRAAIKCIRTIMSRMPQAKKSLRQVCLHSLAAMIRCNSIVC